MGAFRFDRGEALRFIEIERGGLRTPARSVEGDHVALPPPHQKRKTITPDAGLHRLDAQQLVRDYRTTPSAKGELEEALGHPAEIGLRLLDWTRHELASP